MLNLNRPRSTSKTEFFRIYPALLKETEDVEIIHKFHNIFTKQKIKDNKNEQSHIHSNLKKK